MVVVSYVIMHNSWFHFHLTSKDWSHVELWVLLLFVKPKYFFPAPEWSFFILFVWNGKWQGLHATLNHWYSRFCLYCKFNFNGGGWCFVEFWVISLNAGFLSYRDGYQRKLFHTKKKMVINWSPYLVLSQKDPTYITIKFFQLRDESKRLCKQKVSSFLSCLGLFTFFWYLLYFREIFIITIFFRVDGCVHDNNVHNAFCLCPKLLKAIYSLGYCWIIKT